ncbi:transcription antitermination factor NusB [candidate division KSB1 bacterium]|nr:transcription antitermination factor NusB [candidate division KSB1 bacterium]
MSNRRRAREFALRAFYAFELSGNNLEQTLNDILLSRQDINHNGIEFACKLVRMAAENKVAIDAYICDKAKNWDFDRIAILDKLILRMAICEFLYFDDIPPKVTIDEAIEISKKYSTEKSGKFINGILDSILNDLKLAGQIQKKGRGLVD